MNVAYHWAASGYIKVNVLKIEKRFGLVSWKLPVIVLHGTLPKHGCINKQSHKLQVLQQVEQRMMIMKHAFRFLAETGFLCRNVGLYGNLAFLFLPVINNGITLKFFSLAKYYGSKKWFKSLKTRFSKKICFFAFSFFCLINVDIRQIIQEEGWIIFHHHWFRSFRYLLSAKQCTGHW